MVSIFLRAPACCPARRPRWRSAALSVATLVVMGLPAAAHAGFFIPKDNWMAMTTVTPDEINLDLAYGIRRDTSVSVGLTRVREAAADTPSGKAWRNVWFTQAVYLVKRVTTEDGIANAYVFGGPILQQRESGGRFAASADTSAHVGAQAGVWADYETRRVYTRLKIHGLKSAGGDHWRRNEVVAQLMWAPYAADYEDVASWIGVQAKRVSDERRVEITPYVRFFKKDWWIDAGFSVDRAHRKDIFVNFMHLF
jgi:hypothetical protein